jgi:hypothetical protein
MKKTIEKKAPKGKLTLYMKSETVRKLSEPQLGLVAGGGSTGNSQLGTGQTVCLACAF